MTAQLTREQEAATGHGRAPHTSQGGISGFLREAGLVALAILAYFFVRNLAVGDPDQAVENAERLVELEQSAHIAWEGTLQDSIVGSTFLVMLVNWIYIWGHWPVILGTAIALYRTRCSRYYLLRRALVVSGAIGFLFFALFPVAPPRLLELGLVDTVTDQSSAYRALQPPGLTNQYAAFPSLHFGWNLLVGIVLLMTSAHLVVRLIAVVSPLAMAFAVVATANHFVVDVAAGAVVVVAGLAVAYMIEAWGTATPGRRRSRARFERSSRSSLDRRDQEKQNSAHATEAAGVGTSPQPHSGGSRMTRSPS